MVKEGATTVLEDLIFRPVLFTIFALRKNNKEKKLPV